METLFLYAKHLASIATVFFYCMVLGHVAFVAMRQAPSATAKTGLAYLVIGLMSTWLVLAIAAAGLRTYVWAIIPALIFFWARMVKQPVAYAPKPGLRQLTKTLILILLAGTFIVLLIPFDVVEHITDRDMAFYWQNASYALAERKENVLAGLNQLLPTEGTMPYRYTEQWWALAFGRVLDIPLPQAWHYVLTPILWLVILLASYVLLRPKLGTRTLWLIPLVFLAMPLHYGRIGQWLPFESWPYAFAYSPKYLLFIAIVLSCRALAPPRNWVPILAVALVAFLPAYAPLSFCLIVIWGTMRAMRERKLSYFEWKALSALIGIGLLSYAIYALTSTPQLSHFLASRSPCPTSVQEGLLKPLALATLHGLPFVLLAIVSGKVLSLTKSGGVATLITIGCIVITWFMLPLDADLIQLYRYLLFSLPFLLVLALLEAVFSTVGWRRVALICLLVLFCLYGLRMFIRLSPQNTHEVQNTITPRTEDADSLLQNSKFILQYIPLSEAEKQWDSCHQDLPNRNIAKLYEHTLSVHYRYGPKIPVLLQAGDFVPADCTTQGCRRTANYVQNFALWPSWIQEEGLTNETSLSASVLRFMRRHPNTLLYIAKNSDCPLAEELPLLPIAEESEGIYYVMR